MKTQIACILLMIALPFIGDAAAQTKSKRKKVKIKCDQTEVYKKCKGGDLSLYFFIPEKKDKQEKQDESAKENYPAIVFFFGGGWVGGTPKQFEHHAKYLKSRGMIAILADYRTQNSHKTTPIHCVADAKSAIRFVRSNAKKFEIDPKRIAAAGGSAGGHLAAATATLDSLDDGNDDKSVSCSPNALILFNPVYDNSPGQWGHQKVKDYWKEISPADNIHKSMPPTVVFLGDRDQLVPVKTAKSFQGKMKKLGRQSELHIYKGARHGFFNYGRNRNKAFQDTVTKMDKFLAALKFLEGDPTVEEFLKKQKTP